MKLPILGLLGAICLITSCSPKADLGVAQRTVEAFHAQYNAGGFDQIYRSVNDDFRATSTQTEFLKYEQTVKSKLGAFQSAELANYNVVYVLGNAEVRLDYDSKFEKTHAPETFTVKVKDGKAAISGYRLDSPLIPAKK